MFSSERNLFDWNTTITDLKLASKFYGDLVVLVLYFGID